ncbi:MAG: hypothetical protein HQ502_02800 [Alphaproteobacteria bacterium]|nr:hypothetical protein [Alphaproteobacteria bacterium]
MFCGWLGFYPIPPGLETGVFPKSSGRRHHAAGQLDPYIDEPIAISIAAMIGRLFRICPIRRAASADSAGFSRLYSRIDGRLLLLAAAQIVAQRLGQPLLPQGSRRF